MALNVNTGLVLLPFGERPQYGTPYPEGVAVGHLDVTGDASGNPINVTFHADGGFLFRLELAVVVRNDGLTHELSLISSHAWATDKSGRGTTAFDLNWLFDQVTDTGTGFSIYSPKPVDYRMLRRFLMGRTAPGALQTVCSYQMSVNTNLVTFDFDVVFTYWPKTALYLPGFLSSFYESPAIPPQLRPIVG